MLRISCVPKELGSPLIVTYMCVQSDGWHPMGNAVNRDLGSFNHAQQMAPPSVLPPLDRLLTPSPPMLRRWSSQPLEVIPSLRNFTGKWPS